jgi:hypothetical protein
VLTGGLGNPVLATVEWIFSLATAIVAIVLPALAIVIVVALAVLAVRTGRRLFAQDDGLRRRI